ncbi:MAG: DUF6442 family protein [Candidatus Fimivivens sp.]|nr:DUF6442 family protein [Candidatus Fimivivens sp.]
MEPVINKPGNVPAATLSKPLEALEQPPSQIQPPARRVADTVVLIVCFILMIYHMIVGRSTRAFLAIMFAHCAAIQLDEHRASGKKGVPGSCYFYGLVAVLQLAAYII